MMGVGLQYVKVFIDSVNEILLSLDKEEEEVGENVRSV